MSPAVPCASTPIRSGLIIAFTSPREPSRPVGAERPLADPQGAAPRSGRRLGVEQVRDAEEVRDEDRPRLLVDLARRARLLDAAAVHHGDPVAHRQRFLLVVRDEDEGDPEVRLERLQLDLQILAQARVERAERLVEQQHARHEDERAGERDPLLLAAGELLRLALLEAAAAGRGRAPL